jgi:hypothetical protein
MLELANRAKVSTATTGTGTVTLGAAKIGYQTFAGAGVPDNALVRYVIEDGTDWEIGTGTYTADGATLSRNVTESSIAGAALNLSGDAVVFIGATAEDLAALRPYASRADAVAATVPPLVTRILVNTLSGFTVTYIADASGTALTTAGGRTWSPDGPATPQHFGSFGALRVSNPAAPYLLSDVYGTLAAAQAVYPKATALTETVDDMACQLMVDYLRANFFQAQGGLEVNRNTADNSGQQTAFLWPLGTYYLTRPLDLTGIRFGHTFWEMRGDGAVIMGCTPGKPILDLTGSRKCLFSGVAIIVGVWTANGVSRSAIQVGRSVATVAADSHNHEGGWEIKGRFSLGGLHNYASEDFRFGAMAIKNTLDPRVYHCGFDGSDGSLVFATNEAVTWDAGASTGFVKLVTSATSSGQVAIRFVSGTPLADNDVIVGGTSGKTAIINGAPVKEPDGEGPSGRSYCLVQDGDNYWGLESDYQPNPAADTPASFLRNVGHVDCRHTGQGDAMFLCRESNHDYRNAYLVSNDPDGGTAVVAFANTSARVLTGALFDVHLETDEGDMDASTGIDYGFVIDSVTAGRNVTIDGHLFRTNTIHPQIAAYSASSNVDSVIMKMCEIEVDRVNRDVGQILFSTAAKFSFYGGNIVCNEDGIGPFLNLSALADIGGSVVVCPAIGSANVRHATGKYMLMDNAGSMALMNGLNEALGIEGLAAGSKTVFKVLSDADNSVMGSLQYDGSANQWTISASGETADFVLSDTAFFPTADDAYQLGLTSRRWDRGWFDQITSAIYRDTNGVKVLGTQGNAVANSTGTAADNQRAINDLLARARAQGWIAT